MILCVCSSPYRAYKKQTHTHSALWFKETGEDGSQFLKISYQVSRRWYAWFRKTWFHEVSSGPATSLGMFTVQMRIVCIVD